MPNIYAFVYCSVCWILLLLLEVFRLFPESEGVSGDVFEDVLGIGEVTRGAFVGIRKRVHLMPNLKGSPATDNCNRDIILKKVS